MLVEGMGGGSSLVLGEACLEASEAEACLGNNFAITFEYNVPRILRMPY